MGKHLLGLLWLVAVGLTGCRQGGPYMSAHLELMNAEKRALEDELYSLEFDYEDALREIKKLKEDNVRLRGPSGSSPGTSSSPGSPGARSSPTHDSTSPKSDLAPPMVDEGTLVEPKIEIPETAPRQTLPAPRPSSSPPLKSSMVPTLPPLPFKQPPPARIPVSVDAPTRIMTLEPGDPRVTHLFLNPLLTSGTDTDQQPGDDGITIVMEPRNRDNAFVPLAGPISVILLDPSRTQEEGRIVARWDIDANDAQQSLQNSSTVRGIRLRLPWPGERPKTGRLHLYVRYLTVDNRDLRADREMFITIPGQATAQRWTPRATGKNQGTPPTIVSAPPHAADVPGVDAPAADAPAADAPAAESSTEVAAQNAAKRLPPPDATLHAGADEPPPQAPTTAPTQTARPEWRPYR